VVVVRVYDRFDNMGSGKILVKNVPAPSTAPKK
jgi:hypothetical protein